MTRLVELNQSVDQATTSRPPFPCIHPEKQPSIQSPQRDFGIDIYQGQGKRLQIGHRQASHSMECDLTSFARSKSSKRLSKSLQIIQGVAVESDRRAIGAFVVVQQCLHGPTTFHRPPERSATGNSRMSKGCSPNVLQRGACRGRATAICRLCHPTSGVHYPSGYQASTPSPCSIRAACGPSSQTAMPPCGKERIGRPRRRGRSPDASLDVNTRARRCDPRGEQSRQDAQDRENETRSAQRMRVDPHATQLHLSTAEGSPRRVPPWRCRCPPRLRRSSGSAIHGMVRPVYRTDRHLLSTWPRTHLLRGVP